MGILRLGLENSQSLEIESDISYQFFPGTNTISTTMSDFNSTVGSREEKDQITTNSFFSTANGAAFPLNDSVEGSGRRRPKIAQKKVRVLPLEESAYKVAAHVDTGNLTLKPWASKGSVAALQELKQGHEKWLKKREQKTSQKANGTGKKKSVSAEENDGVCQNNAPCCVFIALALVLSV